MGRYLQLADNVLLEREGVARDQYDRNELNDQSLFAEPETDDTQYNQNDLNDQKLPRDERMPGGLRRTEQAATPDPGSFEERAAIMEYDDGLSRAEAEARAFEWCIVEWIYQNPEPSEPGRCAWCGKSEAGGSVVVPFVTEDHGHTWLHHDCWAAWSERRRRLAINALTSVGVLPRR